jgi:hypothetical protein
VRYAPVCRMQDLIVDFRRNFVEHVEPTHLPTAWDVHHAAVRGFGDQSVYSAGHIESDTAYSSQS